MVTTSMRQFLASFILLFSAGLYAQQINLGNQVKGNLPITNGGIGASPAGPDYVPVSTSTTTGGWSPLPNCPSDGLHALTYNTSSHLYGCSSITAGGVTPAGTALQEQLNNGSNGLAAGITHGGPGNLDLLNPGAIQAFRLNYVIPGTATNSYPQQNPFSEIAASSMRYMGNDGITAKYLNLYVPSGGKNYSPQYTGGEATQFEKPNYAILTLNAVKQTEGQVGGALGLTLNNVSPGDTMVHTDQAVATGTSDGDDEALKLFRANLIHNPSRFGMAISSVTPDSYGNYVFRGTQTGSYSGLPSEGLPVIDLSKDLNPSAAGNITDIRTYPTDTRFGQLTPDTGVNIASLLGNSTVSYSTSAIVPPGNLMNGIIANESGVGALSNATMTVASAAGFAVSSTVPVCIASVGANYEQTYITAVNTSTNTLTFQYIRYQHGTNEMVSQGGACGYAVAMSADEKAPNTVPINDLANQPTTLHNAYYVLATISGKLIVYTNMGGSSDPTPHTAAYTNTSPTVAGTLTPTVSGGALTALQVNSTANYQTNTSANMPGQRVLAYPTITFTGGNCATVPAAVVASYTVITGTQRLPVVTITNPGSGCDNTLVATMKSVYANPYHLYPATVSFKVIDPTASTDPNTGKPSAHGYYVMTEAINPAKWTSGDTLEISGWWNQYAGSSVILGKIYGGQSGRYGANYTESFVGDWASPDTLRGIINGTPSSHYWSPSGPSAGVAYELPPDGVEVGGMVSSAIWTTDAPTTALWSVRCQNQAPYVDAYSPCHYGVSQTYNLWQGFTASNTNLYDYISYNNGTRALSISAQSLLLPNTSSPNVDLQNVLGFTNPTTQARGSGFSYNGIYSATGAANAILAGNGLPGDSTATLGAGTTYTATVNVGAASTAGTGTTTTPLYVVGSAGTTAYTYAFVTRTANGQNGTANTTSSTTTGNATLSASNYNAFNFIPLPGATSIDVYRTVGGATQGKIGTLTAANSAIQGYAYQWTFRDTGLAGDGTSPPTVDKSGVLRINSSQPITGVNGTGSNVITALAPITASMSGTAGASTCTDFPVTYTGAGITMNVTANPSGALASGWASVSWGSVYVSATNTVQLHVCNPTAAPVTLSAMNFKFTAF